MANRVPLLPGDGNNPAGAQSYYYPQNGTPPQQVFMNYPVTSAQLQAMNAHQQQVQYQNFFEHQRRAHTDMRNRGQQQPPQQLPGHPQQMQQQQQQQQQQQRMQAMQGYPTAHLLAGMDLGENFEHKPQLEKDALMEYMRSQIAAGKVFPQRGPMPPQQLVQQQQQQQQQRMSGMPGYPAGNPDREDGYDVDQMAEMFRAQNASMKGLQQQQQQQRQQQQQQQQQQRPQGMPGYPTAGGAEQGGDGLEHKTQAEKDALLDLLRTQSGPAKPTNQQRGHQQQQQQQQQQQRGAGLGAGPNGMLPASAVGPHLDPAIASAIATGSPAAAPSMHMSPAMANNMMNVGQGMPPGAAAAAAATTPSTGNAGRGKIEVEDEYGLKPLVKVLPAAPMMSPTPHVPTAEEPTDPVTGRPVSQLEADEINFSFITRGFDITQLGLSVSQQEWLHPTLATLPLDTHNYFILPEFKIPDSYKKPRPRSLSMKSFHQFKVETLFYIFYSMPRDVLHLAAARALYEHGWRYHKREQHWFQPVKAEDGTLMEKVTAGPNGEKIFTGVYNVFHPTEWKQVRTADNYTVSSSDVEEQSVLVAAMEEAARQQSQRSRAKATTAGSTGNGSASPSSATPAASA